MYADENYQELGIALIEPVTAKLDFCRIERDLFATSRTMSLRMEPVSTTLSFEDIGLIEGVLSRLSKEKKDRGGHREEQQSREDGLATQAAEEYNPAEDASGSAVLERIANIETTPYEEPRFRRTTREEIVEYNHTFHGTKSTGPSYVRICSMNYEMIVGSRSRR